MNTMTKMPPTGHTEIRRIRGWIILFMIALVISGATAFPLETEMRWLVEHWPFSTDSALYSWLERVYTALCVLVFPLAFIAGAARSIPICWRLIDCSFGIIGLIPLTICYRAIGALGRVSQ